MPPSAETRNRYDVHLFPVVRLKVSGVATDSHKAALEQALERVVPDLHERLPGDQIEYAEEFAHFLVDMIGDEEYRQSRWFYGRDAPWLPILRRLIGWYNSDRTDGGELDRIIADAREALEHAV